MRGLPRWLWLGTLAVLLAAGCGRETYERRMEETAKYFTYLDKMNQALNAPWLGKGVQLRVPKQFQAIAAPAKKKNAPPDERDPRQPAFADITFPGLQGAFTSQLQLTGKGRAPGYLYVLTNSDLLGKKGSDEKAAAFNASVLHIIAQAVSQSDPPASKQANYTVPKGEGWVHPRTYKVVRPGFAASIDGTDYRIEVYTCRQEKNEVALVYVLPENVSPNEKLNNSIDLSLETLKVTQVTTTVPGSSKPVSGKAGL